MRRTRADHIIIINKEHLILLDTYPIFRGEPWWVERFPTPVFPTRQDVCGFFFEE